MSGGRVLPPLDRELNSVSTCYPRVGFQRNMLYGHPSGGETKRAQSFKIGWRSGRPRGQAGRAPCSKVSWRKKLISARPPGLR